MKDILAILAGTLGCIFIWLLDSGLENKNNKRIELSKWFGLPSFFILFICLFI